MKKLLIFTSLLMIGILLLISCSPTFTTPPVSSTSVTSTSLTNQYVRNFIVGAQETYIEEPDKAVIGITAEELQSLRVGSETVLYMSKKPYFYAAAAVTYLGFPPEISLEGYNIRFSEARPGVTYTGGGSATLVRVEKDGKATGEFIYADQSLNVFAHPVYIRVNRAVDDLTFLFMSYKPDPSTSNILWLVLLPVPLPVGF